MQAGSEKHKIEPSVTIKLTMDELMSFYDTDIDQGLTTKNNEIVQKEELIDTNQKNITDKLQKVEKILRDNTIVTAQDKFLTDKLNTHAANNTLPTYPYATAVKNKGASAGVVEICKILGKQSKISTEKYQMAKNSIEMTNIITNIKQDEGSIATLQKNISGLRKANATTHKQTPSDFCKEYHQKHLDSLISILKSSTLALRFHNNTPDTLNAICEEVKNNTELKEYLNKEMQKYRNTALNRYQEKQNLENRIDNLKNMSQNTEDEKIDIKKKKGIEQVMSTYLTEPEIKNYNYFVDMYKAATSNADEALMSTTDILLSDARLKTDLETEIASTTKQIARLITEHNDISHYLQKKIKICLKQN